MKKINFLIAVLAVIFFFSGCYTQVAMRPDYERQKEKVYVEENYETYGDSGEYYSEEQYYEEDGAVINNYYYGYYPYSRYYWGYYPRITFGIHFGYGYGYYYPYCWDPFYYPWCGTYFNPYYYGYGYYPGYYYYGYYPYHKGSYWAGKTNIRERDKTGFRLRNNDGLRSSYTSRGTLTGRDRPIVTKDRTRDVINTEIPTRTKVSDNTTSIRNNDGRKNTIIEREKKNTIERNKITIERKDTPRDNVRTEQRKTAPPKVIKRNDTKRNDNNKPNVRQKTNTDRKSGVKKENTNPPKNNTPRNYTPPKDNTPPKSYNPPSRNSNPPQNTGNRSGSNSGNRGSSDSGKRTR